MSAIDGNAVIIYELQDKHTEVRAAMLQLGYFDHAKLKEEGRVDLPKTALWGFLMSTDKAMRDLKTVCKAQGATLISAIAILATPGDWVSDKRS